MAATPFFTDAHPFARRVEHVCILVEFSCQERLAGCRLGALKIAESPRDPLNLAFALVVLPVRKLTPDFCRMSSLPWLGFGIRSIFFALATWARRHLSPHWSSEITIKVNHEPIHPAHTV